MTDHGLYRHYKGGLYRVLFVGFNSTNGGYMEGRPVVVYVSLATGRINVRDEAEFNDRLLDGDGYMQRFTPVATTAT